MAVGILWNCVIDSHGDSRRVMESLWSLQELNQIKYRLALGHIYTNIQFCWCRKIAKSEQLDDGI